MANRRFEMHQYRQVLVHMRLGQSDRAIAGAGLMGRKKARALRKVARQQGWLDPSLMLPDDTILAEALSGSSSRVQPASIVLPHQEEVTRWFQEGIQGTTIHQTLVRKYGFSGSYSCVRRFLHRLEGANPQVTTVLDFEPGDAAQVDFGAGPRIEDVFTGEVFPTWTFVMVLAWSRHLYAEFVPDQKVST